jgi:hypothetical protein
MNLDFFPEIRQSGVASNIRRGAPSFSMWLESILTLSQPSKFRQKGESKILKSAAQIGIADGAKFVWPEG